MMKEADVPAETLDISEGGMLCRATRPVEPLTSVYIMVEIPTEQGPYELKTDGVVMHARMEGDACFFGVTFISLSESDRQVLLAYAASPKE